MFIYLEDNFNFYPEKRDLNKKLCKKVYTIEELRKRTFCTFRT